MSASFDTTSDFSAFSFGLDTPSKLFPGNSPFSLNSGLTPSLFGSLGAPRGFTPSLGEAPSNGEFNPFEATLGTGGDKTRRSSFSAFLDGPGDLATASNPPQDGSGFDLLSTNVMSSGRKRALSSPAVHTPGGSTFAFLSDQQQQPSVPHGAMPNLAIKPSKRPRMSIMLSESCSDARVPSAGNSDNTSPESTSVATPPDSSFVDANRTTRPRSDDIHVVQGRSLDEAGAPANATTHNILSQLQQQQSLLLATGGATMSQPQPLPLRPLNDISIKSEPTEPTAVASTMPILTRSASKKGKAPVRASPAPSSATGSPAPQQQAKPKRAGGRKKGGKKAATAATSAPQADDNEEGDVSEDSTKRRQFLERNRIAACKSRQKKKEKVGKLESDAAELCRRNQILQASALALRQEILTLRQIIQTHDGCSCEHAQGYIKRDREGRGIALLDNLAGRTMHLDYSISPSMGSQDDVYSYLEDYARNGTVQEAFQHGIAPPNSSAMVPITNARMPDLAAAPSFTPSTTSNAPPTKHQRRSSDTSLFENNARVAAAQFPSTSAFNLDAMPSIQPGSQFGLTFDPTVSTATNGGAYAGSAVTLDPTAQGLLGVGVPSQQVQQQHPGLPRRQSSAPPMTPSWGESASKGGDYFSYSSANA
ncbi:hypothetical protein JCM10212_001072 [Sporobolomyces blumeae]